MHDGCRFPAEMPGWFNHTNTGPISEHLAQAKLLQASVRVFPGWRPELRVQFPWEQALQKRKLKQCGLTEQILAYESEDLHFTPSAATHVLHDIGRVTLALWVCLANPPIPLPCRLQLGVLLGKRFTLSGTVYVPHVNGLPSLLDSTDGFYSSAGLGATSKQANKTKLFRRVPGTRRRVLWLWSQHSSVASCCSKLFCSPAFSSGSFLKLLVGYSQLIRTPCSWARSKRDRLPCYKHLAKQDPDLRWGLSVPRQAKE